MTDSVVINLPFFPGFYESMLSGTLDNAETQAADHEAEKEGSKKYYPETYQPDELRLDASDYSSILFDCMDYGAAHQAMVRDYADCFDKWAQDNLETPSGSFTFESMDSPREYNFRTDRVYVTAPLAVMESLYAGIDQANLREAIESRHTSQSGFISFYSNDIDDWQDKAFSEFDHNELGTILCAAMAAHVDDESSLTFDMCESMFESDYQYVDSHCDWDKFAEKVREKRAEKLVEWIETDSQSAARYVASHKESAAVLELALGELDSETRAQWEAASGVVAARYYRCSMTRDMFSDADSRPC